MRDVIGYLVIPIRLVRITVANHVETERPELSGMGVIVSRKGFQMAARSMHENDSFVRLAIASLQKPGSDSSRIDIRHTERLLSQLRPNASHHSHPICYVHASMQALKMECKLVIVVRGLAYLAPVGVTAAC